MLSKIKKFNENKAWQELSETQKSYTVRVLHFFHYRRNRIAASWKQEEVLTWELFFALRILPRPLFLKQLLIQLGKLAPSVDKLTKALIQNLADIELEYSPSLQLKGNLRNSCSDIGINGPDGITLWIEAKTAFIRPMDMGQQLRNQQAALKKIYGPTTAQVVALIPSMQPIASWPTIRWIDVAEILSRGRSDLQKDDVPKDLVPGFFIIAEELENRIRGHQNRIILEKA